MFSWWRDVIKEAHEGDHTPVVQLHLRYGMILFIASEVMFFVAWFWVFFDVACSRRTIARMSRASRVRPAGATGRRQGIETCSTRGTCRWSTR